jgi:hypothetical protein
MLKQERVARRARCAYSDKSVVVLCHNAEGLVSNAVYKRQPFGFAIAGHVGSHADRTETRYKLLNNDQQRLDS